MAGRPLRRAQVGGYRRNGDPAQIAADPNTSLEELERVARSGGWPVLEALLTNPLLPLLDLEDPRIGLSLGDAMGAGAWRATKTGEGAGKALALHRRMRGALALGMTRYLAMLVERDGRELLSKTGEQLDFETEAAIWALFADAIGRLGTPGARIAKESITQAVAAAEDALGNRVRVAYVWDTRSDWLYALSKNLPADMTNEAAGLSNIATLFENIGHALGNGKSYLPFGDMYLVTRRFWRVSGDEPPFESWAPYLAMWLGMNDKVKHIYKRFGVR